MMSEIVVWLFVVKMLENGFVVVRWYVGFVIVDVDINLVVCLCCGN